METTSFAAEILKELNQEAGATRKCLERIPESLFGWKPHEKSMTMGYLALLVAEVPKWITTMVESSEIDFATFKHFEPKTTADLVVHFDENMAAAKKALESASDDSLSAPFYLKNNGTVLVTSTKKDMMGPAVRHWVHHRGQLTVYMRLNKYCGACDLRAFRRRSWWILKGCFARVKLHGSCE